MSGCEKINKNPWDYEFFIVIPGVFIMLEYPNVSRETFFVRIKIFVKQIF